MYYYSQNETKVDMIYLFLLVQNWYYVNVSFYSQPHSWTSKFQLLSGSWEYFLFLHINTFKNIHTHDKWSQQYSKIDKKVVAFFLHNNNKHLVLKSIMLLPLTDLQFIVSNQIHILKHFYVLKWNILTVKLLKLH